MRTFMLMVAASLLVGNAAAAQLAPQANAAPAAATTEANAASAPAAATENAPGPRRWRDACRLEPGEWRGAGVPATPVYEAAPDGACFCSMLGAHATRAARRNTFGAWALGTAAAGLLLTGPVIGGDDQGNLWERERGTLLALSGAALAPIAYYLWVRSERASTAAARASQAQSDAEAGDDRDQYRACVAANADWIASREASLAVGNITLDRLRRTSEETKAAAERAARDAEESRTNAEEANKAAEQAQQSAETAEGSREEREEVDEEPDPARNPPPKRPQPAREQP